ncbi:hypothetical protein BASA81_010594 [Batrachochytrium salamandrivorans]|nr:hypothetical protein BASA81_010594 [Batrachochytrium salamandrivorans]
MATTRVSVSIHSELPVLQRWDLLAFTVCLSIPLLQFLANGFSLFTLFTLLLSIALASLAVLAPVYSTKVYLWMCLSPAQAFAPNSPQVAVVQLLNNSVVIRPLLFREVDGKRIPRFDLERRIYEPSSSLSLQSPATGTTTTSKEEFDLVQQLSTHLPLSAYLDRYVDKDTRNAKKLLQLYGENKFDVVLPEAKTLVKEQAKSPFFLFQVGCVLLWMLDEYWYFAVFTLIMLVLFEFVVAQNRLKNIETVRNMLRPPCEVLVKRAGSWRKISSSDLVPLDIMLVSKDSNNPFPCDAILVRGSVVVNEAMLTGESTPKMKDALSAGDGKGEDEVDLTRPLPTSVEDSRHVVLGGTLVLDSKSTQQDQETHQQAVAVVLRTGYETTQGQLMRVILHSTESRVTVDSNREAYLFMFCLVIVATVAAGVVLIEGLKDPNRSQWKLFLHCIMIITSVIPAELPIELSLAVTTSLTNLIQKHAVYCTEPYRIPFAGKVDVCCFDKTGTLTSDDLQVDKVVDGGGEPIAKLEIVQPVLALCQSLVVVDRQVVGDTTEMATWRLVSSQFRIIPNGGLDVSALVDTSSNTQYLVLKRFQFDSNLRRMTVFALAQQPPHKEPTYLVCSKGAPEVMEQLLRAVPVGFTTTYQKLASQGYRVLALASKRVSSAPTSRHEAESDLEFCGFVCLTSPLKADSAFVVGELKRSGHRVVIITGDSELTAANVGEQLDISRGGVLTGAALNKLVEAGDRGRLLSEVKACSVFARVSPNQKEQIIALFGEMGLVTLMVGDGSNDSLSLKRADVGVSVVSHPELERMERGKGGGEDLELRPMRLGDASIASPFTAKTPRVSVVLDIVRQGRCTLVSTIQVFKILAVNGLLHSFSLTFLFLLGVRQGDTQSLVYGLLVAVVFALLSFTQSQDTLTARRPVTRIFSVPVLVSVFIQSVVHLLCLYLVTGLVEIDRQGVNPDAEFSPNVINTLVYISGFALQANVFACNYRGSPFMTSFLDNKRFSRMIFVMWGMALVLSLGAAPGFVQHALELVELPQHVSFQLTALLAVDTALCFAGEFLLVRQVLGG